MRLLPLWMLAAVGWVAAAAAPGPRPQDSHPGEDLGPALMDLARRKRGSVKSSLPYSNYRPVTGIHRYRYPLYRKRSYRPQYDYEDEIMLPEVPEVLDYEDYSPRPSLFRERNLQQQQERKKKELLLEDDGYFTDEYTNDNGQLNPNRVPLRKKDYLYHLYNMPYSDLERLNYMYEIGKRDPDDLVDSYDYELLDPVQGGRKTLMPSPTEQFYDAIDSIRNKKSMYGGSSTSLDVDDTPDHLQKLKNFLTSAAERYWRVRGAQETAAQDPMIRKKRDTKAVATSPAATANTSNTSSPRAEPPTTVSTRYEAQLATDRKKRAFSDYFKYEKRAQDFDDFLTREYFKSIARSVGQKKKRMAYAQFEADKRSSGMEFLENPSMLQYMQTKLKEAEEEVAAEAEAQLAGNGNTENLITNIVVRLDALERMREALSQLEELQEQEEQEAHAQRKRGEVETVPHKQKEQLQAPQRRTQQHQQQQHQQQQHQHQQQQQHQQQEARRKKKAEEDSRNLRRNLRRGDNELHDLFMGNTREDCPVLDRILLNCIEVSEKAGDQDRSFLDACLRHEVCYMCGAGMAVSQHECDAVLSSSLEAACSRNLDCLSAAGSTFNLLSNDGRYDEEGICTHDPCVRQFLESR